MARLNNFDAHKIGGDNPLEPVPSGTYTVSIIDSEWKETKSGVGRYLQLCMEVRAGEYLGRMLWSRLNLDNPSKMIVGLAEKDLASICRAVGVMEVDDTSQLHSRPFMVRVRRLTRPGTDEVYNKIDRFTGIKTVAA